MVYILPTALSVPAPTLQWSTTALTTTDSAGSYPLVLSFGSNTSNTKIVNIQVNAGTATYFDGSTSKAADWMIEGASVVDSNGIVQIIVPGNNQTWPITIRINENLHSSETHVATIVSGTGYRLAASQLTHTATVNLGFIKPTPATTGYGTTQLATYAGGDKLQSQVYDGLLFTASSYKMMRDDIEFHNCWFKPVNQGKVGEETLHGGDYLLYHKPGFTGAKFYNCEFGNTTGVGQTSYSAHVFSNYDGGDRRMYFERCNFHDAGWDHIKTVGDGWTMRECYFGSVGTSVSWYTGDEGAHGDVLQKDPGWHTRDVDVYRCNFDIPISTGDGIPASYNSCYQVDWNNGGGSLTNAHIRSCWFVGGNKTWSGNEMIPGTIIDCSIKNCRVGTRLGTDYRQELISDTSGQLVVCGCVSDHDDDMTPRGHLGQYINNTRAF